MESFRDGPGEAWDAVTEFAANTLERAFTDPLGLLGDVYEGFTNTLIVATNTLTFGVIPGVNEAAQHLVQQNGFYRFIQVTSVVGREFLLGIATGGALNGAMAGARWAGRMAGSLISRVGGQAVTTGVARASAALSCRMDTYRKMFQPLQSAYNVGTLASNGINAYDAVRRGAYEAAAALLSRSAGMIRPTIASVRETSRFARAAATMDPQRIRAYLAACFAFGTKVLWEGGVKQIEEFKVGDRVWARAANDPNGSIQLKEIEECFSGYAYLCHLHLGGQMIRTTSEHPFWVVGKGWTLTKALMPGDVLVTSEGEEVAVEEVWQTESIEPVFNFRVSDFHTYYISDHAEGPFIWAHNESCSSRLVHDAYVDRVRTSVVPQRMRIRLPWSSGRQGRRIYDDYDVSSATAFEGNTTPWRIMTDRQFARKMDQIAADYALLQTDPRIRRVVWFGTEPLPTDGYGGQIRQALQQAGISYWVVR